MKLLERLFGKKEKRSEGKDAAPQQNAAHPASKQENEDIQKKRRILIAKCMEVLADQLKGRMKEEIFTPCSVSCDFPGTRNQAYLRVIPDAVDKSACRLTVNVARKGSDLCVMNYLQKGTGQEIMDWLSAESRAEELVGYIAGLSESVDEKMD